MNFRKADVRPATCCRRLVGRAELLLPARCRQHATVHGEASTATAHWDHEPRRIPLTRPSGTLSPSGGEGWGEGVRFMESLLFFTDLLTAHEPELRKPLEIN